MTTTERLPATRTWRQFARTSAVALLAAFVIAGVVWRSGNSPHPAVVRDLARPHPAVSAPVPASLWLVAAPEDSVSLQSLITAGGRSAVVVPVATDEQAETVLRDADLANLVRAAAGLPAVPVLDLR